MRKYMTHGLGTVLLLVYGLCFTPRAWAQLAPRITSLSWTGEVRSNEEAWLEVIAEDPHGVIMEVQVDFGDGTFTFAHTFCVQGDAIGTPARLLIPHIYAQPGDYLVRAIALSAPNCRAPGSTWRESAISSLLTHVVKGRPIRGGGGGGGGGGL